MTTDLYLYVPDLDEARYVKPEVALRKKDRFEIQRGTGHGVYALNSPDIITVYRFLQPKKPNRKWVRSEVERFDFTGYTATGKIVEDIYQDFRDQVFKYFIGAELLVRQDETEKGNAVLVRKWKPTPENTIDPEGLKAMNVHWIKETGLITSDMVRYLGAPTDTHVKNDPDYIEHSANGVTPFTGHFQKTSHQF